ncbi:hypothetical protein KI659_16630 [Litoribacter alkaliphilus]|uniref:Uncharacterized protein n=1 Tax=Litoribacter ruber TaxID=702568 RepID=A0AAP2CJ16_9BACT|nr:DUF6266 family protein [Litoribacter alkaliphilus]MBS9525646.1 hypothetical protein [Litoribacter alkaliphilus]
MAKADGPEKHYRGKTGSLVYYRVKGVTYVRKHVEKIAAKPPTKLQEYGQRKFRLAGEFFKPLKIPVEFGFQQQANGMRTGTHLACGWAIKNGFKGSLEDSTLDPSLVKVSGGTLTGALSPSVRWAGVGKVLFEWEDNSNLGSARRDDQVMVTLYNVEDKAVFFVLEGNFRWERQQVVSIFRHDLHVGKLEAYISFSRPLAKNKTRDLSDSVYVGRV